MADTLGKEVTVAAVSGITAAITSAPFIAIIDAAITSNASGREPLWSAVKSGFSELVKKPAYFVRKPAFLWISAVYSATYLAANMTQLTAERANVNPALPKFAATSATNILMSMAKSKRCIMPDWALYLTPQAIYAAQGKAPSAFPVTSLALFAIRDSMTVAASFTLPPRITPWFQEASGLSYEQARGVVQLLTPLAAQVFSVPLHLTALDLYNNPNNPNRVAFVRREYGKTVLARWGRILPAFGIGGVINLEMQDGMRWALDLPQKH